MRLAASVAIVVACAAGSFGVARALSDDPASGLAAPERAAPERATIRGGVPDFPSRVRAVRPPTTTTTPASTGGGSVASSPAPVDGSQRPASTRGAPPDEEVTVVDDGE